ncbi:MAG TPA: 4Fe-4S binding protein [Thermotogota bacterium]|nr:4Fe-4S binding protein [Thermotogota bacterium]HOZ12435.1 4Fe-4S binding protein [Thermotogota bacterium]
MKKALSRKQKRTFWKTVTKSAGILLMFGGLVFRCPMSFFIFPGLNCYAFPWGCAACPMGVLQNFLIFRYIPFFPVASLSVIGLLAGRGWCGWFCPFGTFQDALGWVKRRGSNPWIKYVVLVVALALAFTFKDPLFCKICPAGTLEGTLPNILIGIATFNPASILHIAIFIIIVAFSLWISRFWCRFLCPVGAILGLFNRVTPLQINFSENLCVHCDRCSDQCPQGLDVPVQVNGTDCIKCGQCTVCSALKFSYRITEKSTAEKRRL